MTWSTSKEGNMDICCDSESVPVFFSTLNEVKECTDQHQQQKMATEYIPDFEYTPVNVHGPGRQGLDPQELQYAGCQCKAPSCEPSCPCIFRFGPNYTAAGRLLNSHDEKLSAIYKPSKPVFECNASCLCGEECVNRLVQRGVHHRLEVFRTKCKGWGLRALELIQEDEFVCEYAGEILEHEEARARTLKMQAGDMNYIFVLKESFSSGNTMTYIDAKHKGSIARFINHSCEPNLFLVAVRVDNEIPRIAMFARRDIAAGEELGYRYCGNDYESEADESINCRSEEKAANAEHTRRKQYMCESKFCQKYLPSDSTIYKTST